MEKRSPKHGFSNSLLFMAKEKRRNKQKGTGASQTEGELGECGVSLGRQGKKT